MSNTFIEKIYDEELLDFDYTFNLSKIASSSLRKGNEAEARELILAILDNWSKVDSENQKIWLDLLDSAGLYPYFKEYKNDKKEDLSQLIRVSYHNSENIGNITLHSEQKNILNLIEKRNNLILSAPTSFGKSLLIEEIIASLNYNNIIIIQPTLALIHETYKKLTKYSNEYNIILNTKQELESKNIFILTSERVMEIEKLPDIDFLVVDEFYKFSNARDDERADILNIAVNFLINKYNPQLYFLGPNIDYISRKFIEKNQVIFYKTDFNLVNSEVVDLYATYCDALTSKGKVKFKEKLLFDLLWDLREEQTIIYCSSPDRVRSISQKFLNYLKEKDNNLVEVIPLQLDAIVWIEQNFPRRWSYTELLKNRIGVHHGGMLKHLNESVVEYFNSRKLNYLFCTSTLIEGVNTSAKNIAIFDNKKGGNEIDYFDFSNIKGRAGRFMQHILGRIYLFNEIPVKQETVVDIPFIDQNAISDELLINIEKEQIIDSLEDKYNCLLQTTGEFFEVVRDNYVSVNGQVNIIRELTQKLREDRELICWKGVPKYEQLEYLLGIAWDNLLKPGETTRPMTKGRLVYMTFNFGFNENLIPLINNEFNFESKLAKNKNKSRDQILDTSIVKAMQFQRHWLKYKVPKWLNVLNILQKEICEKIGITPGDYSVYAQLIENENIIENLTHLLDLGIPATALKKIQSRIPEDIKINAVLDYINENKIWNDNNLLEYEKNKLKNLLNNH
ncbi:DEAD/DEAH box helicase [Solibacillus daqui]|uniref:DEAD/DEAH box helicase n=1 Tax=Solibacillus daqui TaxID=2912187 RepID=UPI0023655968|nr:DEAD/DEAH box helicase [Solibacillus daqui]